jgi:hypothetical protein
VGWTSFSTGQSTVESGERFDHETYRKAIADPITPLGAVGASKLGVLSQVENTLDQSGSVAWWYEKPGFPIQTNFTCSIAVVGDNW